jgi:predicted anti-sigma-YlaC factor YlaD
VTAAGEATCDEVAPVVQVYVFGRLGPSDASRVRGHLQECADCRSIVDEIDRDTADFLEATGLDELPEDLVDLIIEAAAEAAETPGCGR